MQQRYGSNWFFIDRKGQQCEHLNLEKGVIERSQKETIFNRMKQV